MRSQLEYFACACYFCCASSAVRCISCRCSKPRLRYSATAVWFAVKTCRKGVSPRACVATICGGRILIETTSMDLDTIATQVGYADGATLRMLIRRKLGRGVRELRDLNRV